jgi:hypothetical protein
MHLYETLDSQGITDSILEQLSDADLRELGVDKLGERRRLLAAFAKNGNGDGDFSLMDQTTENTTNSNPADFTYTAQNGEIIITGCIGKGLIKIPNQFDNLPMPVRRIGDNAFSGNQFLLGVEIPDSVTTIGDTAFHGCSSLTSVEIPDSVTTIGYAAFHGCSSLTSVEIPGSVTTIGERAFDGCSSLTSVKIPGSVTTIGKRAFDGCSSLTSVEIPGGVTTIGDTAFHGCSSLTSVEIPDSVTTIGNAAFHGCSSLTSVKIPNSVRTIGDTAFAGCSSLTSVKIPNSVTTIGDGAFYDCGVRDRPSLRRIAAAEKNYRKALERRLEVSRWSARRKIFTTLLGAGILYLLYSCTTGG